MIELYLTIAGAFVLFVLGFLLMKTLQKDTPSFEDYYNKILNSEEYKVKGQFEE